MNCCLKLKEVFIITIRNNNGIYSFSRRIKFLNHILFIELNTRLMSYFSRTIHLFVTIYNTPQLRKRRESSRPSPWLFANLRRRKDNILETMKTVKLHLNDQKGFPLLNAWKKLGKCPYFQYENNLMFLTFSKLSYTLYS